MRCLRRRPAKVPCTRAFPQIYRAAMRRRSPLLVLAFVAFGGLGPLACADAAPTEPTGTVCTTKPLATADKDFFKENSEKSGLQKNNFVVNPPAPIPINDHSRLAFVDINGDGWDDAVMHSLFPNAQKGIPMEHLIFLNNKDGTFRDASVESGLKDVQAGFLVFGDVDNDGDEDCFAGLDIDLPGKTSQLLLNDGNGRFTPKADSGLATKNHPGNAVFADFDGDAKLDIFLGNGQTSMAEPDELYFGNGDGTFRDGKANLVSGSPAQPTNGLVTCDYDNDGDLDIFVATYGVSARRGWNHLWENDGTGTFTNVAKDRGFHALATGNYFNAKSGNGRTEEPSTNGNVYGSNAFGIDCGDFDNDGRMDIYLAAISHADGSDASRLWSDPSQLLRNEGAENGFHFTNEFLDRGLPFNEGDIDAAMIDYDNDGRLDLAVTRDDKYEGNFSNPEQKAWFGLYHQERDRRFTSVGIGPGINDVPADGGPSKRMKKGQNLSFSDVDHDGDLDLLVGGRDTGGGRPNFFFENTLGQNNSWIALRVLGDGKEINRDAFGTRVTITYGKTQVIREKKSSRGTYDSLDGSTLLFGLGDGGEDVGSAPSGACVNGHNTATMTVRWPNGKTDVFTKDALALGKYLTIRYVAGDGKATLE